MTAPRVVDATTANRLADATAIVFEYMAQTEVEAGATLPRTLDELPPTLAFECANLSLRYARPGAFFLALQRDAVIGCVGVGPDPRADASTVEVKRLYVRAAYRRRGVAAALLHAAHEHARSHHFTRALLTVMPSRTGAIASYERLGYRVVAPAYPIAYDMVWLARNLSVGNL
jgi:GNAT superfamily N-acetyltransferase